MSQLTSIDEPGSQYRRILDSSTDGIFTLDHRWCFTYVNPAAVPMLRHYSQQLLGKLIWEVLPDAVGTEFEARLRHVATEMTPAAFETYSTRFEAWLAVRVSPCLLDGSMTVYLQDVTQQKRAEMDQRRLAAIVASTRDAIVGVALDGTVTDWNPGAERLLGYSSAEMVGQTFGRVLGPDHTALAASIVQQIERGEHVANLEVSIGAKNGRLVDVSLSVSPLRTQQGKILGAATIARDLTSARAAEAERRLLATALEASANAILITDATGSIIWANPAFSRLTGYALDEIRGQNPRLLKSGHHAEEFYAALWQTVLAGKVFVGDMINRRKDGSLYREHMTITPVRATQTAITHFIAIKEPLAGNPVSPVDPRPSV